MMGSTMSLPKDQAWFPAKRYGWGWGIPRRWQGWLVCLAYFAALLAPTGFLSTPPRTVAFFAYAILLSGVLVAVCVWKGEKPGWRWGGGERA
jgi:hypothetical protein